MIRVHPCLISVPGSPSGSIAEVNARQSLVAFFHARPHLRNDLVGALRDLEDATRIVQKFLLGRGDASDLSAMSACISIWAAIRSRIALLVASSLASANSSVSIPPSDASGWANIVIHVAFRR